jgi:hypothetical protein
VIEAFDARFEIAVIEMDGLAENVHFKLPRALRTDAAEG